MTSVMTTVALRENLPLPEENRKEMNSTATIGKEVTDGRANNGDIKYSEYNKHNSVIRDCEMPGYTDSFMGLLCEPQMNGSGQHCVRDLKCHNESGHNNYVNGGDHYKGVGDKCMNVTDSCVGDGERCAGVCDNCAITGDNCTGVSDNCTGAGDNYSENAKDSETQNDRQVVNGNQGGGEGDETDEWNCESSETVPHVVPPDGGWGWVVVFASFMSNVVVDGIIFSYGVFLGDIINAFDEGKSKTALVGSLLSGFYLIVGPFVSSLANRFGFRMVSIVGSVVSCFAMVLSFFATSVDFLCFSFGIIGGVGFGLIYVPAVIAVGFYFEKKRALATGISVCGSGIGTFIMAPLTTKLIQLFGWRGAMLILGGICLHCAVFGCLFRPIPAVSSRKEADIEDDDITQQRTPLLMRIKRARDELQKWDSSYSVDATPERAQGTMLLDKSIMANGTVNGHILTADAICRQKLDGNIRPRVNSFTYAKSRDGSLPSRPRVASFTGRRQRENTTTTRYRDVSVSNVTTNGGSVSGQTPVTEFSVPTIDNKRLDCGNLETHDKKLKRRSVPCILTSPVNKIKIEESVTAARSVETFDFVAPSLEDIKEKSEENSNSTESNVLVQTEGNVQEMKKEVDKNKNTPSCEDKNDQRRSRRRVYSRHEGMRPFYRDDIFFSASLMRLSQYTASHGDLDRYHRSVTHIPTMAQLEQEEEQCHVCPLAFRATLANMLDVSLLKSPTFLLLCINGSLTMIGLFVPFMFLADRAMLGGVETEAATFLISVIGMMNTAGRVVCGWISDHPRINALFINNVALTFGGIGTILSPHFNSYTMLVVYSCVFGLSLACFASLRSILLVELLGLEKLTNAFGILLLFQGVAATIGAPIAGAFFDSTQSYNASFYLAGSFILLSGILCYPLNILNRWEKKRRERKEQEEKGDNKGPNCCCV